MHTVVLSLALAASTWWPADALLPAQPAAQNLAAEADRLREIRKAVEAAELQNVRVIEGGTVTTNLPDLVLVRKPGATP